MKATIWILAGLMLLVWGFDLMALFVGSGIGIVVYSSVLVALYGVIRLLIHRVE